MCSKDSNFCMLQQRTLDKALLFGCAENVIMSISYSLCVEDLHTAVHLSDIKYFHSWFNKQKNS